MNPKQRVIAQIKHQETDFIPYRLAFESEGLKDELDGFYGNKKWQSVLDNHILYLDQANLGLAIPDTDPKFEGLWEDCFGGKWDISKHPPHLVNPPLREPSLSGYKFPKINESISPDWMDKSIKLIAENPDYFIVARLGFGIFERSWALRGFENSLMDAVVNTDFYADLLAQICEFQLSLLDIILQKIPVDGILFADDWGYQQGVTLGADRWRRFLKPYIAKLYKKAHYANKFTLNHTCGSVNEIIPDLIEIGLDVLESVQPEAKGMNPYELKKNFGHGITFFGGLGSQSIIQFGSPKDIEMEIKHLVNEMGKMGGYILAPAKPIQPGTTIENIAAIVEGFLLQAGITL